MRIDSLELFRVAMPLIQPFRTAFGDNSVIEAVLVRMRSGDRHGWGETSPWARPEYSPEYAAGCFALMRDHMGPLLVGRDVRRAEDLQETLGVFKGNPFARAGFDLAWWDLYARAQDKPLWRVLGGTRPEVEVGEDFGILGSIDELLERMDEAVEHGFKRVKLKYRPGWELDMVARVRERFPDLPIHIDCNSAYTLNELPMFRELDRFNLAMIEQPLRHDDLIDHAALQARLRTPICLDESINSIDRARQAIAIKACRWVNIKPGRVGGLTVGLAINRLCEKAGIPCWVGGMLESAVGAHHCLALATLANMGYPSDIFASSRFYARDMSTPPMTLSGRSLMRAPDRPGCGAEPDPELLDQFTVDRVTLTPR